MLFPKDISEPFLLNALKHHIAFARYVRNNEASISKERLVSHFQMGGNLFCDYYYGALSIQEISSELKKILHNQMIFERVDFENFIKATDKEFFNLTISDGSEWTFLMGNEPSRYIHIHPARYSPNTIRVRFLALKTAILLKTYYNSDAQHLDYELINEVRCDLLNESPVKINGDISHLKKIMEVLDTHL